MDVAVLLNFTSKLTFEVSNPLISVINADESLLFYDRLSVEQFPADTAMYQPHFERLASSMRNMLEARSLSAKDNNEKIRVIVTLDLANGAFQSEDKTKKWFPAQRVRLFKEQMERIFEKDNPLLKRFDYIFIFIANPTSNQPNEILFKTLAYDGYTGGNEIGWFGWNDIRVNDIRDAVIKQLASPDDNWLLTDSKVQPVYTQFKNRLKEVINTVSDKMAEAGLSDEFRIMMNKKVKTLLTIRDFSGFNYDEFIASGISQLIGLAASDFRQDCSFFIITIDNSTAQMRCKSEVFASSLVQFLVTLDTANYMKAIKPNAHQKSARLFVKDILDADDIDVEAFSKLERMISICLPQLDMARWRLDMQVENCQTYAPKAQDASTTDTHKEVNDKLTEQRQEMSDTFKKIRKIPFFFGKSIGDWSWYKNVIKHAETIYHFETVNDRPLYDLPKRITDNEIEQKEKPCTYAQLENEISTLTKEATDAKRGQEINNYLKERSALLEKYGAAVDRLKKEMVKLGYLTCLLWICIFMIFGFTLAYAYHFFWYDTEESPWLIAICAGVAILLLALSSVIGQAIVKSNIKAIFKEMDDYYEIMQNNLKSYLKGIADYVKSQDEADIRRKNLDEMNSKMEAFYRHNKQIDLWVEHYKSIIQKLIICMSALRIPQKADNHEKVEIDETVFEDTFPMLPNGILCEFSNMSVMFSDNFPPIKNVTSFVKHFRFVERLS